MISDEMDWGEGRIRRLEEFMLRQERLNASVQHKLGQVAEDNARQFQDDATRRVFVRAQAVGTISATSGNSLGNGTARLLQVIAGDRYRLQAAALGDVTVPVVQDTGGAIPGNTYLIIAAIDGLWTVLVADCGTESPSAAPDPPA